MSKATPHHQLHKGTYRGRHIDLMGDVKQNMVQAGTDINMTKILSFGCSTGEECLDLADVFENAHIFGAEIDPETLRIAQKLNRPNLHIFESTEEALLAAAPFDAIFAMNVLCLTPLTRGLANISHLYAFEKFNSTITLLDRCLTPGGFLTLYNAQYFLEDTDAGSQYCPAPQPSYVGSGWVEKSRPNGDRVSECQYQWEGRNYRLKAWRRLLEHTPEAHGPKHGRYKQVWLEAHNPLAPSLDTAVWHKNMARQTAL